MMRKKKKSKEEVEARNSCFSLLAIINIFQKPEHVLQASTQRQPKRNEECRAIEADRLDLARLSN
jgi:hypothetical protein